MSLSSSMLAPRQIGGANGLGYDQEQASRRWAQVSARMRERLYPAAKRALDVVVSSMALLALSPVLILTAILIKLQDGGPSLFIQRRVGKAGEPFDFYKFRSMIVNAERRRIDLAVQNDHRGGVTFKMRRDPRITAIGRLIRRASIDELPQLFNVLKGDMTLVGPRPGLPSEVSQYTEGERRRLTVSPGLTCFWQVDGRALLSFDRQVELDIMYIEKRTFLLDLQLIARTIPAVISGRGAF